MAEFSPAALLAFLDSRSDSVSPVADAIYEGLADRIRRGDFDTATTTCPFHA